MIRPIGSWPDLLLIDGGKGQLGVVLEVLDELGVEGVAVAGISKGPDRDAGREQFHVKGKAPFMLEQRDPVLYYVQRLRDEAHRFAIGSHRAQAVKGDCRQPAGRDRRYRAGAQEGTVAGVRIGACGQQGIGRRPGSG
jgi:excinuclease ABC subunit C